MLGRQLYGTYKLCFIFYVHTDGTQMYSTQLVIRDARELAKPVTDSSAQTLSQFALLSPRMRKWHGADGSECEI